MAYIIDTEGGQALVKFEGDLVAGKTMLATLGFSDKDLYVAGGNLRFVIQFDGLGGHLYHNPTFEIVYHEKVKETTWQVELNGHLLLEKADPSGNSTLLMLNRKKMEEALKARNNEIIVRSDMPLDVTLDAACSFFHLVEVPGSDS